MATQVPTRVKRDANLDSLNSAVQEWYQLEKTRLENEVKFMRSVQKGRGVQSAGETNLLAASALLQAEIDAFVVFEK